MICFQSVRIGMLVSLVSWSLSCAPAPLAIPPTMSQPVTPMRSGIARRPLSHFGGYGLYEDEKSDTVHGMVCMDQINLFPLRTNAMYANPEARSKAVASVLEETLQANAPHFMLRQDGGDPAIYAVSHLGGSPRRVVTVTAEDAVGYSLHSGRTVTQDEVAHWWLGLLEDLVGVLFLGQRPHSLPNPEGREALTRLAHHLTAIAPTGPYTAEQIGQAWQALSPEDRNTIQTLTSKLPASGDERQAAPSGGEEGGPALRADQEVR